MPRIYLSNDASDVTGYKLAYVDMRSPQTTVLSTSVTTTTGSGDNIQATDTAGGTALKWITKPFLAAQTLVTKVFANVWMKENAASANSGVGVNLYPYSAASEGSVFLDANGTVEAGTTIADERFLTAAATSQAFAAGDRLVVKLFAVAVGTMGVGTLTIDYDGPTDGADGDTWIDIQEPFRVNERQVGDGATPWRSQTSSGDLQRAIDDMNLFVGQKYFPSNSTVRQAVDSLTYEQGLLSPRTAVTTPV